MGFSFKKILKKDKGEVISPKAVASRSSFVGKGGKLAQGESHKIKPFRATSGAKYALIIGDEGAILVYMVGKVVQSRNFIAHASADNLKEFETILSKNINAPIFLIIDSMDQSFVQQSLPPISPLGVKKLIKKRLDRDLGADVIKGYILLERDSTGRRDWNFLMVALESSPHLNLWFEFIDKVNNRLNGIYLLSVEAENIVKNIDNALGISKKDKKKDTGPRWKFFVVHNKVGGFRQVILRDGRIIFTRLTQPVGEVTTEVIAGNIEQEMTSTVEYMKRLSFNPQQGLGVYIVASDDINSSLNLSRVPATYIHKFTPFQISELFAITGATQSSDQFGDVILSAFIASSRIHRLVLSLPKAIKINQIYDAMRYQRAAVGLAVLGMLGYSGVLGLGVLQKYSEIENLTQKKAIQQRKLDAINAEIKKSGIDIKKIGDSVALYKQILSESNSPLQLLSRIRAAIISPITIKDISWQTGASSDAAAGVPPAANKDNEDSVTLVLRFPEISSTDEAFKSVAKKVLVDVRAALPEYKVVYTKLPDALSKKSEAGEINFDDKEKVIEIDKAHLEATLSLVKQSANQPPVAPTPPSAIGAGNPTLSTDELIGLGK